MESNVGARGCFRSIENGELEEIVHKYNDIKGVRKDVQRYLWPVTQLCDMTLFCAVRAGILLKGPRDAIFIYSELGRF